VIERRGGDKEIYEDVAKLRKPQAPEKWRWA
jgi:hypothetical protein